MTVTTRPADPEVERSLRWYRMLLVAYPRDFRDEFGDDLVQSFRDLMIHRSMGPASWWRVLRDLVVSAPKERASSLARPPGGGRSPLLTGLIVAAAVGLLVLGTGPGPSILLVPGLVLVVLPAFGLGQLWKAWRTHRTVGSGALRHVLIGIACMVPAPIAIALLGEDAGWYIFIGIAGGAIALAVFGIVWGIATLVQRPHPEAPDGRRPLAPKLALVAGVLVLAGIIGASFNSYLNSLGPPGDHSVANASADTRALWEAADRGDLAEVERLTAETCADPWVKFPFGNGRHNPKGQAEVRGFPAIADHLGHYQNEWEDRCSTND